MSMVHQSENRILTKTFICPNLAVLLQLLLQLRRENGLFSLWCPSLIYHCNLSKALNIVARPSNF